MTKPSVGDPVFHLVSGLPGEPDKRRFLFALSRVRKSAAVTKERPSLPGSWAWAESFFRIELSDCQEFNPKLPMDEIEAGLEELILSELEDRPKYYPYAPYRGRFRGAQGISLAQLSSRLTEAFYELVNLTSQPEEGSVAAKELAKQAQASALLFSEGERSQRESAFFRRNPRLREEAIRRLGVRCIVCRVDLGERHGPAGEGYIEIHHLNPLAERKDAMAGIPIMTQLDEVVPLCANCHRVIHRQRRAMTIAELKAAFRHDGDAP